MSIGFKEWALVCEALGRGDQSVIIRKGGIAEGRAGFRFEHNAFFLFPTLFHEQLSRTVLSPETPMPEPEPGVVRIGLCVQVEWTALLTNWQEVQRLAPFHIWREDVIAERFRYDKPAGVHIALLRVFRLNAPWSFPDAPAYGGCRSWLTLPEPPKGLGWSPVLGDGVHTAREEQIRAAVRG